MSPSCNTPPAKRRQAALVVLGDSLSDNGNMFSLIGMPAPPYWEGRSSNTPRFILHDQNPAAERAFIAEFKTIEAAFDQAEASRRCNCKRTPHRPILWSPP